MKKYSWFVLLVIVNFLFTSGSTCSVKTCPPEPYRYKLHRLTERGFNHIFRIEQDCSGCHHIVAQKCGLVKIKKIRMDKKGVFTAIVEKVKGFSCIKKESTFFPEHWSVQTTLNKIEEAYLNAEQKDIDMVRRELIGTTSEGIRIKIIMDNKELTKIFNAYPIIAQENRY